MPAKQNLIGHVFGRLTVLCLDHCHNTGAVRGLICRTCNLLLGYSKDNRQILQAAINYLEN